MHRESQARSTGPSVPCQETASRQKVRRPMPCALRKAIISLKKRKTSRVAPSRDQSSQVISLSWLYGLLLPPCVFRNSSPATNIGIPLASISSAQKFLTCCRRSASTAAEAPASPSAPQFQLRL